MDITAYFINGLQDYFPKKEIESFVKILSEDVEGFSLMNTASYDSIISKITRQTPIQYITGVAPFYGFMFEVNKAVLIPRPETEELVYVVEKYVKKMDMASCKILDIGTGSGCIPITLSKLFPKAEIVGVDISEDALSVARSNNVQLGANVSFMNFDILNEASWKDVGQFDIIISNPPYIPIREKTLMAPNVLDYEPHLALFVEDQDPLLFYRKILDFSCQMSKNKAVFLECNEYNASEVSQMYSENFRTRIIQDLQGKDRIVEARK